MRITRLSLSDFRNIASADISPGEGVNIIYGLNAQGKTNLLEAIWLCSGSRSFRGAKEREMTRFGENAFHICLEFADRERVQEIRYDSGGEKKSVKLNKVPLSGASELIGEFICVVFHPEDLNLVKEGPAARRLFLDNAISQIKPVYSKYINQYSGILEQRNALLKQIRFTGKGRDMLDLWDDQLSKIGTAVSLLRQDYIKKLSSFTGEIYSGFTGGKESMSVGYSSSVFDNAPLTVYSEELIALYREKLSAHIDEDIRLHFTGVGVHRDDIDILVNGLPARAYGSQGQQRSCAVSLKIGEAALLKSITGEMPVILLDDVMSELDPGRQDYLLNKIKGSQVMITCCDTSWAGQLEGGKVFHVENGVFTNASPDPPGSGSV